MADQPTDQIKKSSNQNPSLQESLPISTFSKQKAMRKYCEKLPQVYAMKGSSTSAHKMSETFPVTVPETLDTHNESSIVSHSSYIGTSGDQDADPWQRTDTTAAVTMTTINSVAVTEGESLTAETKSFLPIYA